MIRSTGTGPHVGGLTGNSPHVVGGCGGGGGLNSKGIKEELILLLLRCDPKNKKVAEPGFLVCSRSRTFSGFDLCYSRLIRPTHFEQSVGAGS